MWWKCQLPLSLFGFMTVAVFLVLSLSSTYGKIYLDGNTNGYTGIVVALAENAVNNSTNAIELINNIKLLMTNASQLLYETTGNRLYFKHITILLPYSWRAFESIHFNGWSKNELFHFASVHVGPMNPDHGDTPYTLQREDCMEQGDYIHLTPDYIATINVDDFTTKHVNTGVKDFVVEWVKFRFGVFAESNLEEFYYDPNEASFRPTYCSNEVANGQLVNPISKTHCLTDELGMPLEYCQLEIDPKSNDNLTSSLLFSTKLPNVAEFCNETTHNKYAPTLQNRRCHGKSAWEIMRQHADFLSNASEEIYSTQPEFRIVTAHQFPSVSLAIDTSSKANKSIADSIVSSISLYVLFAVPFNTTVEVVAIEDESTQVITKVQVQYMADRKHLIKAVENILLDSNTSARGFHDESENHSEWHSGAVIYITTSAEAKGNWSMLAGARFLPVFLNVNPNEELTKIADNTDGNSYAFFGEPWDLEEDLEAALFDSSNYWDGEHIIQIFSTVVEHSQQLPVNFLVDKAILGKERIVISAAASGGIFEEELLLVSPDRFYQVNHTVSLPDCERQLRDFSIEDGKAGLWSLRLTNNSANLYNRIVIKVFAVIPQCTRAITSTVRIHPKTVQVSDNNVPVPRLTITLKDDGGFYNPTSVTATVFTPFSRNPGENITKYLLDDGSGSDVIRHDGVFSTFINYIVADGVYKIVPRVYGGNSIDCVIGDASDCFQRQPCPLYFQVIGYRIENGIDNVMPGHIANLVGKVKLNTYDDTVVTLLWTAPGDDTNDGIVSGYELQIFDNYENALSFTEGKNVSDRMIIGGSLDPVPSGGNQSVTVRFSSAVYGYKATGYISIRAFDEIGNRASGSNIVIIPLTQTTVTTETPDMTTTNFTDDFNATTPSVPMHNHAYDGVISSLVLLCFAIIVAGGFIIEMQFTKCREINGRQNHDYIIGLPISDANV